MQRRLFFVIERAKINKAEKKKVPAGTSCKQPFTGTVILMNNVAVITAGII